MKNKYTKIVILFCMLFLFAFAGTVYHYLDSLNSINRFYCEPEKLDFLRIPVKNGRAEGIREIKIFNDTDENIEIKDIIPSCPCVSVEMERRLIPPKSCRNAKIVITLDAREIIGRNVNVLFVSDNKTKKSLKLTILASPEFSNSFFPSVLRFQNVYFGNRKKQKVTIYSPNQQKISDLIQNISFEHPELFRGEILKTQNKKIVTDETKESYFINSSDLEIIFSANKELLKDVSSSSIFVELKNGEKLKIPIAWTVSQKLLFEPVEKEYFLVNIKSNETRDFQIIYNEDVGGKLKKIRTIGARLVADEHKRQDDSFYIKLKYTSGDTVKPDEKVGELIVETEDGKTHKLEVIAS